LNGFEINRGKLMFTCAWVYNVFGNPTMT